MDEKDLTELDKIEEAEVTPGGEVTEQPNISCNIEDFKPRICRSEKTAILFLGTETKDPDNILNALSELEDVVDMDMGVLDMADESCEKLSEEYKIDRQASQLVIFQNCNKIAGLSLEGDLKDRIEKLKELLEREAKDGL